MDHIAGLERLLRLRLHRPQPLTILGPTDFVDQIQSRLGSYSWNLLDGNSVDFRLIAQAFDGTHITEAAEFPARKRFARLEIPLPALAPGVVLSEPEFEIRATVLDHGIPSLAFGFRQRERFNVWRTVLDELGLPVGPWIDEAKKALREGHQDDYVITVPGAGEVEIGVLRARVFHASPGQNFAYVTDAADTQANRARIVDLAEGADQLFIEAAFLEEDRDFAEATRHLTARAAGEIARSAHLGRVIPFHYSARYGEDISELSNEVAAAFTQS